MSKLSVAARFSRRRCRNRMPLPLILSFALCSLPQTVQAAGMPFQTGDILAGVGNGQIKHFRTDGTLIDTLTTGVSSYNTGMAFDAAGNLYATAFDAQHVYKFDNKGNLLGSFGSGYSLDPESILFDQNGNAYVGQADGLRWVFEFDPTGSLIDTFAPDTEDRGTDWLDLDKDNCTLFYTSEGQHIKRYNVCTKQQLPDFATLPQGEAYALRIRPNGDVLVAATEHAYRLDSSGSIQTTYSIPGAHALFALNLDPDNKTFWSADILSGTVYRVDISTGAIITHFTVPLPSQFGALAGLTVVGELTAATTAPRFTQTYYIHPTSDICQDADATKLSALLKAAGKDLGHTQTSAPTPQQSVVALLFGAQRFVDGKSGATLWECPHQLADIASLVEAFADGYYNCFGTADCPGNQTNEDMHVRIVIATNNSGASLPSRPREFGAEWGSLVNTVASYTLGKGYSGRVAIAGGSDMEPAFNSPQTTRDWVDGYTSTAPRRFLYNVGSADGCPYKDKQTAVSGSCATALYPGWKQDDVWYISWGANPSQALPEIYTPSQATQWAHLSLYGYLNPSRQNGGSIIIAGALTESGACNQGKKTGALCQYSPQQGWLQLYNELGSDTRTRQSLPWSTDIRHLQKPNDILEP